MIILDFLKKLVFITLEQIVKFLVNQLKKKLVGNL